jgi:hypothetical protein
MAGPPVESPTSIAPFSGDGFLTTRRPVDRECAFARLGCGERVTRASVAPECAVSAVGDGGAGRHPGGEVKLKSM